MDTRDYEVEDLLLDKSFQNYCLGTNEEDVLFWKAWMNFHPEKKDMIRQAKELYTILDGNHSAAGIEEDRERFKVALSEHDIFAGQSLLLPVQTDERQTLALPRKKGLVKKILVLAASAAAILLAVL